MGIAHIVTLVSVFLAGLVPASCHKTAPQQKTPASSQVSAATAASGAMAATNTVLHDLGEVSLTNHYETCVQLGVGKKCTLSPKMLDDRNLQITFALETKTNTGQTRDLSVAQVVTRSGKPVEIAIGDFNLTLTPKMADE